ncbi:MAG: hypothetical protein JRN39_05710 [Nitrososphaerota archaeon]|nr:hypothetical protein [Nitrososphaerota archaeon]
MSSSYIRLKLKKGSWEIDLECQEDRVTEAIQKVLAGLNVPQGIPQEGADEPRGATCKTLLEQLWQEGWFAQPRPLGEVDDELGRRGYHYDRTAVSHSLTDLVREQTLSREGAPRNYKYVQKRPPEGFRAVGAQNFIGP